MYRIGVQQHHGCRDPRSDVLVPDARAAWRAYCTLACWTEATCWGGRLDGAKATVVRSVIDARLRLTWRK